MNLRGSEGYILASAIAVILSISIVAAALVGASSESLSRLKQLEEGVTQDAVLQSALSLLSSEIAKDPRRRAVNIGSELTLEVLDRPVQARVAWENDKADLNSADPETVATFLTDRGVSARMASTVLTSMRRARSESRALRLLDDLNLDEPDEACAASLLTVFGGRTDLQGAKSRNPPMIGQPGAGSRLAIELFLPRPARSGLRVVVLMTGDPLHPMEVLDWKRTSGAVGEESCHDAQ